MKTKLLLTILLAFIGMGVNAQNEKCATMEVLKKQLKQDPTLQHRMDSLEQANQEWMKQNGYVEDFSQLNLPLIPGFEPTGNPEVDVRNFAIAKQKLYAENPELYRKLTRNETTNKNKR